MSTEPSIPNFKSSLTGRFRDGFTLVELMIVVMVIGILMAIALPDFVRARTSSRTQAVVGNLMRINDAKLHFSMDSGLPSGSMVHDATDLVPKYLKEWPAGPVPGDYVAHDTGSEATFNGQDADWYSTHCSGSSADSACTL